MSIARINLLPWRSAHQQKLRKQWFITAGMVVLLCMSVLAARLTYVWQQSRVYPHYLQRATAHYSVLLTDLQHMQVESSAFDNALARLLQATDNYRRHAMWQGLAEYPEAFSPGFHSGGLQLGLLTASAAQWQLAGVSSDAQRVNEFLTSRPGLQLTELQLRADGWYEFSLVHVPAESQR